MNKRLKGVLKALILFSCLGGGLYVGYAWSDGIFTTTSPGGSTGSGAVVQQNAPTLNPTVFINGNTSNSTPLSPALLDLTGADATSPVTEWDTYAGSSTIVFRRANNIKASLQTLNNGDTVASIGFLGYNGTAYTTGYSASINLKANELWTTGANGSFIEFVTTNNGSASPTSSMTITPTQVNVTGDVRSSHVIGSTSTPTATPGTGAGTGGTVTAVGNDTDMQVTIVTGTTPTGSNAIIGTITYNKTFTSTPHPTFSPANATADTLSGATGVFMDGASTSTFTISSGATGLLASTTYKFNIHTLN